MDEHEALRTWARGSHALAASVELLIRAFDGRFARPEQPWIMYEPNGAVWLDDAFLASSLSRFSSGERRVMSVVVALADPTGNRRLDVGDVMSGIDRGHADLVLAALAHASGSHEHTLVETDLRTGTVGVSRPGSLHPWPDTPTPERPACGESPMTQSVPTPAPVGRAPSR